MDKKYELAGFLHSGYCEGGYFHPHVHMLVTAGGLAPDDQTWVEPKHPKFLVPDPALSVIFRAKFCAGLKKAGLLSGAPVPVWKKRWVDRKSTRLNSSH